MRFLTVPLLPLLMLAALDWSGKTVNSPGSLVTICAFVSATSPAWLIIILIAIFHRRNCRQ